MKNILNTEKDVINECKKMMYPVSNILISRYSDILKNVKRVENYEELLDNNHGMVGIIFYNS